MRKLYGALTCLLLVIETLAVLCALTQPAYAYVDPGSGLLAVQIVSTTFASMIFLLRRRLRWLIGRISGHSRSKGEKESKQ